MGKRFRITFEKTEAMRFTSHLDLYHAMERTLRRAGIPLEYSQGYKPHPRINIAAALPLGFTSRDDLMDIWLKESLNPQDILIALQKSAPPGIIFNSVQEIDCSLPSLQSELIASEYTITILYPESDLETKINKIRNTKNIPFTRREKEFNFRERIIDIVQQPLPEIGQQKIVVILQAQQSSTGRPEDLLNIMGIPLELTKIQRTQLIFKRSGY